jgi:hypothetical protein
LRTRTDQVRAKPSWPDKFRVDFKSEGKEVFVFGREVKAFRPLDYDAIAMLDVSATQQLQKGKGRGSEGATFEIAELKAANHALRKGCNYWKAKCKLYLMSSIQVLFKQEGELSRNGKHGSR